jgi:c-di-GMP-binding flagellar brake protein YcgR
MVKLQPHNDGSENLLSDAVARNGAAVLSLPSAGMFRHTKSRFLHDDAAERGIWLEVAPEQRALIDQLIASKRPAVVSFKSATKKVSFAAVLLRRDEQFRINAQTTTEAVLMARPRQVKAVQRRNDYRVRVRDARDDGIKLRLWRIGPQAHLHDRPIAAQELAVELRDLSLGGLGVVFPPRADGQPLKLVADERLRVELRIGEQELLLEGRLCHLPKGSPDPGQPIRAGVQFLKLEDSLDGREALAILTRVIGTLQRQQVRRIRLGLTQAG